MSQAVLRSRTFKILYRRHSEKLEMTSLLKFYLLQDRKCFWLSISIHTYCACCRFGTDKGKCAHRCRVSHTSTHKHMEAASLSQSVLAFSYAQGQKYLSLQESLKNLRILGATQKLQRREPQLSLSYGFMCNVASGVSAAQPCLVATGCRRGNDEV